MQVIKLLEYNRRILETNLNVRGRGHWSWEDLQTELEGWHSGPSEGT